MVYLDNNATTRPCEAAVAAARHALDVAWANPSSVHRAGQEARREVELARASLAAIVGAAPREVTFTSGGTEAIALGVRGVLAAARASGRPPRLVTTTVEHAAVRALGEDIEACGVGEVVRVRVSREGIVDPGEIAGRSEPGSLVCVGWANNETGAIQPVREIARACRDAGALVMLDATQWVGKMPADLKEGGRAWCDLAAFAPHKFHGPKGVGCLWARPGVGLAPLLPGSQELGRRAGTENVPGIAGAGAAAREAIDWLRDPTPRERLRDVRDRFESAVLRACAGATVNGPIDAARRLWNTTNIGFPGIEAEVLLLKLSERGVAASAGAACSSGSLDPSPVLLAMGVPGPLAHGSLRFSLSRESREDEVMLAAGEVARAVRDLTGG